MLSNFTKFSKTLASTPLPPRLHPELHRGIDPGGSFPASAGWPTALTATWRGSAVPGCWQRYGDLGEASPASIQQYSELAYCIRCAKHWSTIEGRRHQLLFYTKYERFIESLNLILASILVKLLNRI